MFTFAHIFERCGPAEMARRISSAGTNPVEANTAYGWKRAESIPAQYFRAIADAEIATLDELAEAAAHRGRASAVENLAASQPEARAA